MAKIGERGGAGSELGVIGAIRAPGFADRSDGLHERGCGKEFFDGEYRGRNSKAREPASGVGERAKAQLSAGTQVGDRFADEAKFGVESPYILSKRKSFDGAMTRGAGRIAGKNFFQAIEFENFGCRAGHNDLSNS
jgi:hypothetical protein